MCKPFCVFNEWIGRCPIKFGELAEWTNATALNTVGCNSPVGSNPTLPAKNMLKVYETRKRSLLKAISFRIIEIAIDSLILSFFVTPAIAVGLAVTIEGLCFILHFIFERIWNKINYGRHIIEDKQTE